MTIIDLFSGFGWDVAAHELGLDPIGLEMDADACATRALHGMATIRTDVAAYPAERFGKIEGLIASPPCQDFSRAGKRGGLSTERGQLVFQVERWVEACHPEWVACEQTEDVLPIWEMIALRLRKAGYRTWTGLLKAERYGVPQTRTRAVLMAHRDLVPHPPVPTHQEYVFGEPARYEPASMFHGEILPWVSMAEALGWDDNMTIEHQRGAGMAERHGERAPRPSSDPSYTITSGAQRRLLVRHADIVLTDRQAHGAERRADEPAPTITASLDNGNKRWVLDTRRDQRPDGSTQTREFDLPAPTLTGKSGGQRVVRTGQNTGKVGSPYERDGDNPAPTVTSRADLWTFHRPATTVACDPRVLQPGGHHTPGAQSENAIRLHIDEGKVLQSLPADFEVCGTKTSQWRQIGNMVPPLLARAILEALGVASLEAAA